MGILRFEEYAEDPSFDGDLREQLDDCLNRFTARRDEQCVGQSGAGGEGGGS
jgi:hypothetical protein